ncbi:Ldh family oxidoreductase [Rhodobacterales bacterium HKCCSP123]|nr:Ldh family oxidoreductase [Rhodobacterales bacterium HKCCSP123]
MMRLAPADLRRFVGDCYMAMGMAEDRAALVADSLVQADLWGHASHGVMRTFWYAARIASGATRIDAPVTVEGGLGAVTLLDANDGIGQVAAQEAMERAIAAARVHGIGAVSVRNSGHFGTAMYFTRQAAAAGCVGFLSTNASPAMAPWGGREKRVGNNPWSWAAPAARHPPMVLDIANTAVARGKLYAAKARGEAIPQGWAIDAQGVATTDPADGIAGTILPMAGHKGYAISMIMDMLSGVLSGSGFGPAITGPYMPEGRSGVGHLAIAINIAAVRPLAEFEADMEALIASLKSAPRGEGVEEIFYPGEIEARSEARALAEGIALPADVVTDLTEQGAALGVRFPA